jgi:hypothetical protein
MLKHASKDLLLCLCLPFFRHQPHAPEDSLDTITYGNNRYLSRTSIGLDAIFGHNREDKVTITKSYIAISIIFNLEPMLSKTGDWFASLAMTTLIKS